MVETVHIVLNDFGRLGLVLVETDPARADPETIVRNMLTGQYDQPIRVDAYNVAAGTAHDASGEIARLIAQRCPDLGPVTYGVRAFCERNGVWIPEAA